MIYGIGKTYLIELKQRIFYTGIIIEEDDISIKLKTIRNEFLIVNKSEISQSRFIPEDSIEGRNERK